MPRFDGTGPAGMGPMTGRGMGPCNLSWGGGCGFGRGMGRGVGRGRGMGWGRVFGVTWPWNQGSYRQPTASEEKTIVQDDIAALKEELEAAEERLSQLENQK